ncbi:Peptidylprolyl isomerase [Candidatus Koribacter versatilis Ellin345]|uniref:Peptidyl-prolyl cis-trans isomerase n=1 Tax=Koribacter versatilis (strain Ellin345) TaxID=204669 RepID=Q1ING9_KORVE|nr:peptidylprolyl isomerase [Candidatus Koribacter versatilis]ABF41581.1 Peptidylprolyl isomerase [Candidatus Koribacter versatilis Ellin345]
MRTITTFALALIAVASFAQDKPAATPAKVPPLNVRVKPAAAPAIPAVADKDITPELAHTTLGTPEQPVAVIETTKGTFRCVLFKMEAPLTVENFIGLARGTKDWTDPGTGFKKHNVPLYTGTQFHRVIPNFMVQGGDPMGTGMGDPGYKFKDEFNSDLNFDRPARLAMANSGANTNGSQFFITEVPTPHLNQKHTIFGQCDNVDLVQQMARVPRDERNDKPTESISITGIKFEGVKPPAAKAPVKKTTGTATKSTTTKPKPKPTPQ